MVAERTEEDGTEHRQSGGPGELLGGVERPGGDPRLLGPSVTTTIPASAIGAKASPACSGDRPSPFCSSSRLMTKMLLEKYAMNQASAFGRAAGAWRLTINARICGTIIAAARPCSRRAATSCTGDPASPGLLDAILSAST